jgi:bifunctional enzyme CysN/CysC
MSTPPPPNGFIQTQSIAAVDRAKLLGQRPMVLWFTGLSGAGKSTIANLVDARLHALGRHAALLDGDNLRRGICSDLGFSHEARAENVRRVSEVAKLMTDAGLIVLVALISPFRAERQAARALFAPGEFVEIFVDAPLALAEQRDPKGLYKRARRGELTNFTGLDSPYENTLAPDLHLDTAALDIEAASQQVLARIAQAQRAGP